MSAEVIELLVSADDRHALVVRRERAPHVQAPNRLVDGDECQRLERRHYEQQPEKVRGRVRREHQQLDVWVPAAHAAVAVTA